MDIFSITKSKTREKILQLFFSDPEKKYYLRELERMLEIPVANIRRELLSLGKKGLFKREKMGKQVYYYLNRNSAVFDDLKSIVSKTIGIEGTLKKELSEIKGIKRAFVFGSFAKNKEDSASDIDIMVIGDVDEDLLIDKISKIEELLRREINYHLFGENEWEERAEKDSFVKAVMSGPKIEIV